MNRTIVLRIEIKNITKLTPNAQEIIKHFEEELENHLEELQTTKNIQKAKIKLITEYDE